MPFSTYLPEHMGSIELTPSGPFVAGSHAELTLTYTAGTFGIDDTGMVKISWRTTSDMSKPQFDRPTAPNFTTVEASNGAKLEVWFDRLNIRPCANTLLIRVGRGYLRAGDTLTVRMGDRRQGSPGFRLQTNCEERVELKTSIDAFATYEFTELPEQPGLCAGARAGGELEGDLALACGRRRAVPPRDRRRGHVGQPDRRGRAQVVRSCRRGRCADCRRASRSSADDGPRVLENLVADAAGDLELRAHGERRAACRRPIRCASSRRRRCDATGAICTARAERPSAWARRKAISATRAMLPSSTCVGHQGNDFQITDAFWPSSTG